MGAALACALTTFILLFPANLAPLLTVDLLGADRSSLLSSGILDMWRGGWVVCAVLLGAFGIVLPVLRFGGLSAVLASVLLDRKPSGLGRLYRWVLWLDLWAMPDVFLIGFFIGFTRVAQHLDAHIGTGGFCFIAVALLTMLARACLDRRAVWRAIAPERDAPPDQPTLSCTVCDLAMPTTAEGQACPRCGLRLRTRKPDAVTRSAALTAAALVLYLPANLYPMTVSTQLGRDVPHRIIDGVRELFQAGLWPFGILIFCTSIAIPLMKLVGMSWFILSVKTGSRRLLRVKTHLYRAIDELGRWSNVDVLTLVVFIPLIKFGGLANARPAPGSTAFTLVVFLTMLASHTFDCRLLWDAAGPRRT